MIDKELIISSADEYVDIALLEDKNLVELSRENKVGGYSVGDIYLGATRKTMSGLNACFVSIGSEKDAFLHYLDLGHNYRSYAKLLDTMQRNRVGFSFAAMKKQPTLPKEGNIAELLKSGQQLLVQVVKEAISTKGPRVSTEISLTGRHVVLLPFENKISISQKIRSKEERERLKDIVASLLPRNFGVIIRTAAVDKNATEISTDISELITRWNLILTKIQTAKVGELIIGEENRAMTIIRDLLNSSFTNIQIDDKTLYSEVKEYIKHIAPEKEKIVKYYNGTTPLFDHLDITRQVKGMFGKIVPFKRKSYMVIEHTEALHVIDINSGSRVKAGNSQEDIAMEVNSNAVEFIARQLRLRDMGGIIVIDFIDLHKPENRNELLTMMREAMKNDRAKHNVLPLTKFGLMQITRQRVRPVTTMKHSEVCPSCRGTGEITPSILLDKEIEMHIEQLVESVDLKYIKIKTNPYVMAYLKEGFISRRLKMMFKYHCYIKLVADESFGYVDSRYYDKNNCVLSTPSHEDYEVDLDSQDDESEESDS
ncbi:MAG: Rne/Rng family ribonuclease [Rikenellaceae bacterium]